MAVRAWLETAIPPVFGKEMDFRMADISNTGISHFFDNPKYFPLPLREGIEGREICYILSTLTPTLSRHRERVDWSIGSKNERILQGSDT